ncbi:hypothetical protein BpHYR1_044892, partial [Brachionus plicatilis]
MTAAFSFWCALPATKFAQLRDAFSVADWSLVRLTVSTSLLNVSVVVFWDSFSFSKVSIFWTRTCMHLLILESQL